MALIGLDEGPDYTNYDERNAGGFTGGRSPQGPVETPPNPYAPTDTHPAAPVSEPSAQPGLTGYAGPQVNPTDAVSGFYRSMLGRDPEAGAVDNWLRGLGGNIAGIQQAIFNSPEAVAFRGRTPAPPSQSGPQGLSGRTSDPNVIRQYVTQWAGMPGADPSLSNDPEYWVRRIIETGGLGPDNTSYWQNASVGDSAFFRNPGREGNGSGNPMINSGFGGTSVFSDPATKNYEQLLNALTARLQTPYQAQDLNPALDYMRSYFQQLQGPAYTPAQMDLQQTQALDPLNRQREAAKQRVIQRLSARGISQSSGIFEKALQDVDHQFDQLQTQTQAGFANNAIGLQKQQQAQAAQLGPLIAALEQQAFANNENRALQGVNLAGIVPNLAWSRLIGANNTIQPLNPASLFGLQNNFQQQGYAQGSQFTNGLFQLLSSIFG